MKTLPVIALVMMLLGLVGMSTAAAAPNSGSTVLLDSPKTGTDVRVLLTIYGAHPVVPYGYSIENDCLLPTGHTLTSESDPIVSWTGQDASGDPTTTMTIHLESIPAGSSCKVFMTKNNTAVKGSVTAYAVLP